MKGAIFSLSVLKRFQNKIKECFILSEYSSLLKCTTKLQLKWHQILAGYKMNFVPPKTFKKYMGKFLLWLYFQVFFWSCIKLELALWFNYTKTLFDWEMQSFKQNSSALQRLQYKESLISFSCVYVPHFAFSCSFPFPSSLWFPWYYEKNTSTSSTLALKWKKKEKKHLKGNMTWETVL